MNQTKTIQKNPIQFLEERDSSILAKFRRLYSDAPVVVSTLERVLDSSDNPPWMVEFVLAQINARTIPLPRITPKEEF